MADEKKAFEVEIITPERIFYTGEATMIEFNTTEGEIGVYPEHGSCRLCRDFGR